MIFRSFVVFFALFLAFFAQGQTIRMVDSPSVVALAADGVGGACAVEKLPYGNTYAITRIDAFGGRTFLPVAERAADIGRALYPGEAELAGPDGQPPLVGCTPELAYFGMFFRGVGKILLFAAQANGEVSLVTHDELPQGAMPAMDDIWAVSAARRTVYIAGRDAQTGQSTVVVLRESGSTEQFALGHFREFRGSCTDGKTLFVHVALGNIFQVYRITDGIVEPAFSGRAADSQLACSDSGAALAYHRGPNDLVAVHLTRGVSAAFPATGTLKAAALAGGNLAVILDRNGEPSLWQMDMQRQDMRQLAVDPRSLGSANALAGSADNLLVGTWKEVRFPAKRVRQ